MLSFLRKLLSDITTLKRPEKRQFSIEKDKMVTIDSAESVFSRNGIEYVMLNVESSTATFRSLEPNPNRVNLYHGEGKQALCVYYYKDDISHIYLSSGKQFIRVHRDEIYICRKAFRRFTQNVKFTPPKKRPDPYPPPPVK